MKRGERFDDGWNMNLGLGASLDFLLIWFELDWTWDWFDWIWCDMILIGYDLIELGFDLIWYWLIEGSIWFDKKPYDIANKWMWDLN